MSGVPSLKPFLLAHFPAFIGVILAGCLGGSGVISLAASTYFADVPMANNATLSWFVVVAAGLFVANSNFLVVRGYAWAVWGMVGFFVLCLLVALPTLAYRPHWFIYSECLFWPLLGLLLINSKGYRLMVGKLVEVRRLREAAKAGA
ncbi:hypothetical protein [Pseudomonas sp. S09G 359]|jgi:hypothetical protein|uniref:hypothetical protein n=1 Tax=Pseudomonas sp. S09G 359 TaxID=2054919 RepID=UPI000C6EF95C|nr:hypothetical protein [Pseudomonas sp. S09G 359]AUG05559.1 hypothetical protein CXQ82_02810 [Pseudomonas sp. S09G 359]